MTSSPATPAPDERGAWQESVVSGARNPINWLFRAEALLRCAAILEKAWIDSRERWLIAQGQTLINLTTGSEPHEDLKTSLEGLLQFGPVAMMLRGFAAENLLKGLLVVREPEVWVRTSSERLFSWTHDLVTLASDAKVSPSAAETEILRRLTIFVEWGGRYPTALKAQKQPKTGATWSTDDLPVIERLTGRLRELLENEIRNRGQVAALEKLIKHPLANGG
jgi:hypothetical protein